MTPFDRIIDERRSIRKYTGEIPDRVLIDQMLFCACHSPSPSHSQPVRYLLIENHEIKDRLKEAIAHGKDRYLEENDRKEGAKKIRNMIRAYYRFSEFMFNAPYLFAVGTRPIDSLTGKLRNAGLAVFQDKETTDLDITTGLSLSAFILKGTELGISTCILTAPLVYIANLQEILKTDLRITSFVTAGYAAEKAGHLHRITVEEICRTL